MLAEGTENWGKKLHPPHLPEFCRRAIQEALDKKIPKKIT
jgi:hypothetical protein